MGKSLFAFAVTAVTLFAAPAADNNRQLFQAIRNDDLAFFDKTPVKTSWKSATAAVLRR